MTIGRERRLDLLATAGLLLVVVLLLWPLVFAGRAPLPDYLPWFGLDHQPVRAAWNPLWYDAIGQYWPWRTLLHNGLRANQLPYWDPYQLCGYAIVGNGQSALFYPVNWLVFSLPVMVGFCLTAILHLWLAGLGSYAVVRQLGGRPAAGLAAGIVYQLSAFMTGWLMLPTLISSATWLPVAVACLERCRATRHPGWSAASGGAVALAALAGHPQIFFYVGTVTGALVFIRLRRTPKLWLPFGLVAIVGSFPMVMPLLELAPRSHRPPSKSAEGLPAFLQRSIPLARGITLFVPEAFGESARGTIDPGDPETIFRRASQGWYWGYDRQGAISPGDYSEFGIHVGVVTLWLVLLALFRGDRAARGYALLACGALWLAFGQWPVGVLYRWLPGFSAGAGTCRLAMVWCFAAAVVAGLTIERLSAQRATWRDLAPSVAALLLLWVAAGLLAAAETRTRGLGPLLEATGYLRLLGLGRGLLCLLVGLFLARRQPRWLGILLLAELLRFSYGFNPTSERRVFDAVASRPTAADAARTVGRNDPRRWGFYRPPDGLSEPPNFATIRGERTVGGYDSLLPSLIKDVLHQAAGGQPISPAINGNMLLLGNVDPAQAPTARFGRARQVTIDQRFGARGQVAEPSPNRVLVDIHGGGTLLLRDAPYPGWRVWLGQPGAAPTPGAWLASPYAGADRIGRLVPLPGPGRWQVRFVFDPLTVRLGIFGGLLALSAGIACILGGGPRSGIMRGEPSEGR